MTRILWLLPIIFGAVTVPGLLGEAARAQDSSPKGPPLGPSTSVPDGFQVADDPEKGREAIARFLEVRRREAHEAYDAGNFRRAWQLAEAILLLAPDVPYRRELRQLRRDAQGRFIAKSVVVVSFHPAEDLSFPTGELRGEVRLENFSPEPITVGRANEDPVLGMLHFRMLQLAAGAPGESLVEGTRVVRMPEIIRVESGETHRIPVTIPVPEGQGRLWMQRWSIGGTLRPITVRVGGQEMTRGIPWLVSDGVLLPGDLAEIEGDPLSHLRTALLTGDFPEFAVSSTLWWQEFQEAGEERTVAIREQMIDELLATLGRHEGRLDRGVIRILEKLTGVFRERTARSWQIWGLTRRLPESEGEGH